MAALLRVLVSALLAAQVAAAAAAEFPDRLRLRELLLTGDYAALEAEVTRFQRGYESGELPEDRIESALRTFDYADPDFEDPLDRWVEEMPTSYAARTARGIYSSRVGWTARGGALAKDTSEAQFAAMRAAFAQAVPDLAEALRLNQHLSVATGFLINIMMATSARRELRALLEAGLRSNPGSRFIRYEYIWALQPKWGGSFEEMRRFLAEMERQRPGDPYLQPLHGFPYYFTAYELGHADQREAAIGALDIALSIGEHYLFLELRAWNRYLLGRYDEALADYDRALALRPHFAEALQERAWAHRMLGHDELALADYDLAIRLTPREAHFLRNRATMLTKLERFDAALADFDAALELAPDDSLARNLRGALLLWRLDQPQQAVPDLKRATELEPHNAAYWYDYGSALQALRDCAVLEIWRNYLTLCESGSKCPENQVEWTVMIERRQRRHKDCARDDD